MAPMKGKKKMTTYAVEFVNQDGNVEIIPFNREGRLKSYIAEATRGPYEELAFNEMLLTKVLGQCVYEDGSEYTHQGIMQMTFAEDGESVPSFDVIATFDKDDWLKMYDMATELDDVCH
jgi:hypothetical protein